MNQGQRIYCLVESTSPLLLFHRLVTVRGALQDFGQAAAHGGPVRNTDITAFSAREGGAFSSFLLASVLARPFG